jgi:hypothetical protein
MRAIEVSARGCIELPAVGESGQGFGVKLWIRPATAAAGAVFAVEADGGPGPTLAIGAGGALELRHGGQAIAAAGAVAAGRWTQVAAELAADGSAAIFVDGFRAAAGALPRPGAGGRARIGDPEHGAGLAVADVRVFAGDEVMGHYAGELDGDTVRDAGPLARHGTLAGAAQVVAAADLDVLADARPGALVWDEPEDQLELPALTTDFTRGITVEAWIRPRAVRERMTLLELGADGERIAVMIEPTRGFVNLELVGTNGSRHRAEIPGVVGAEQWQHLCVAIDAGGLWRVFVDARQVYEKKHDVPAAAREGARTRNAIGRGFSGEIAELRVWQGGRSLDEVRAAWLRRARGDEERLVLCYHLDTLADGLARDGGSRRLHARPRGRLSYDDGLGLPLRALGDARRAHVRVAGKLLLDELPLSLFPDKRIDVPWGHDVALPVSTAPEFGTVHGSLVRCAVYEVGLEPRAADGTRLAGEVEVRVDGEVTVVRGDGGKQRLEVWKPGATRRLAVTGSGRARVRVLAAKTLDCPALRVRAAGMDDDCWTLVRPADAAQRQLHDLSAAALKRPPPGKTPVLKPDMSSDDAEAVTRFIRDAARALPSAPPRTFLKGQKISWGDVWAPFESAGRALGEVVVELGDGVAKLTIAAAEGAQELAQRAAGAAVRTGEAAINNCIKDARKLAVDASREVWGAVTVVGEMVVDGAKKLFRTVVAGVLEVAEAIEAFLRRIGAKIRDFIEFLAMLFDWERFLRKSDEFYELALRRLEGMRGYADEVRTIPQLLDDLAARASGSGLAGKTIGQAFGIDADRELPDIDQLKYLVDAVEEAFSGSPPKFDREEQPIAGPTGLGAGETAATGEATVATLPPELTGWRGDVLDVPMDMFLELPQKTWAAGRSVVEPMTGWVADQADELVGRARGTLTARLKVPYLTDLIEVVILRGRRLDLLRLIALLAAVPAVVAGGSSRKSAGEAGAIQKSADDPSETDEALRWTQFGVSVFNSAFFVGRTVSEWQWNFGAMFAFSAAGGATTIMLAALDLGLAARFADEAAKATAATHALLVFFGGAWMIGSTGWALVADAEQEKVRAVVDTIVEAAIGVGEVATTIIAYSLEKSNEEELGTGLGVKLANWTLRGAYRILDGLDNSRFPAAYEATTTCAMAILVVDLGDVLWSTAQLAID